jgi:hypothetical protein
MLKTFLLNRPFVVFDASNKDHRLAYREFLKTGTWNKCAYQFVCEEPFIELPACINIKLVEYYMRVEFKNRSKPKNKIRVSAK